MEDKIPVNIPPIDVAGLAEDSGDPSELLVARNWLSEALRNAGAESYGAGIGGGQADIDVVVAGLHYNVSIKPSIAERA